MHRRRPSPLSRAAAAWALAALAAAGASGPVAAQPRTAWEFAVRLDGRSIGTHRFAVVPEEGGVTVRSEAAFDVKVLGWTAYRYRHRAQERWRGDCLDALEAETEDDGRRTRVHGRRTDAGFALDSDTAAPVLVPGCLMSFAYWHPALAAQRRLLDPGTGRVVPVEIVPLAPTPLAVQGREVEARGWRIAGLASPVDVWYAGSDWIGLDTRVQGRRLSYRLR